ncbi:MAG TPA: isoaspartyl peptidase/L-asparaginase [Rubricoccaceae bacterium]|jgi:beta-aspartyl-peptidase (threonine type)
MRRLFVLLALVALAPSSLAQDAQQDAPVDPVVLVVHGGAGALRRGAYTPEQDAALRAAIADALRAGHAVLTDGRPALDAVQTVIERLEDDPQFNAGRGAVLASDGTVRHDASVMDGATGMAGASAGTRTVRHPIRLARMVMERSPHVMLAGDGAEAFARENGLETMPPEWFVTPRARAALDAVQARERSEAGALAPGARPSAPEPWQMTGTVGAVALDAAGHLAAGTSTGGMTNKRWDRIGDTPVVGAGTFASDATVGVSATGHGEFFIRLSVAHDIHARVAYLGETAADAADHVVHETLSGAGGTGGVIVLDRAGHAATPFNTDGMIRGTVTRSGRVETAIYADEPLGQAAGRDAR